MIIDYFINAWISFIPFLQALVFILIGFYFIKKAFFPNTKIKGLLGFLTGYILISVILSLLFSSNLPKNETFDRETTNKQISKIEFERKTNLEGVRDISRQPDLNQEQRAKRFDELVDFRNKTQVEN